MDKRACGSWESRWPPLPMNACNPGGDISRHIGGASRAHSATMALGIMREAVARESLSYSALEHALRDEQFVERPECSELIIA
ncbi:hypothetical protein EVAR_90567_1 [Eumeta japonica]|uniref:Uncharacterized protein n=1 Tax=Eumeta variegata TaxID=151549 RepID=A0A4C1YRE6_EUMVA|nr:hypothetical protein EVAR_90567_1 [Eumeta japonica]